MSPDEQVKAAALTDMIAVVLLPRDRQGDVDLLPIEHLTASSCSTPWGRLRGARCESARAIRGGTVVRARESDDGVLHLEHRYDDVVELLTPERSAEALLNALWALSVHGLRGAGPHIRALRLLARLELHPDERVRADAREAAQKL